MLSRNWHVRDIRGQMGKIGVRGAKSGPPEPTSLHAFAGHLRYRRQTEKTPLCSANHSKTTRRCSIGPRQYIYVGFSRRKILRSLAYTIVEKAIRLRHRDYNPDRAQKLTSSSMSRHLSTRNISSKSMHAFLSNLANRQTDRQTNERGQPHLPPHLSEVN